MGIYITSPNITVKNFHQMVESNFCNARPIHILLLVLIKINHPVLKTYFCFSVPGTEIIFTLTMNISQLLLSLNHLYLSKPCIIVNQTSNCNRKHANPKLKVHYSHNRGHTEAFHNDTISLLTAFDLQSILAWGQLANRYHRLISVCVNDSPFHSFAPNHLKLASTMMIPRK